MDTKEVISYWYKKLNFPEKYDDEFYSVLNTINIPATLCIEDYHDENDGKETLLSFLYFCENLKKKYEEKGIPLEILYDTLADMVRWTNTWSDIKGELFMGETIWLKYHLNMILFKLGRLQFCFGKALCDIPPKNILKGDDMIEIHIPAEGSLSNELCLKSIEKAKSFFKKYYPEYEYKGFTCHSWLLDSTLKNFLTENSNIIKFQNMFDIVEKEKSDDTIKFVFNWDTTRENLKNINTSSEFSKKIKEYALNGNDFFVSYGLLKDF